MPSDDKGCRNILDYQSRKSRLFVWYAMAAEVYAFVETFDAGCLISKDHKMTHGCRYDLIMYTDLLQLYDALTRGKCTDEKRFMMDSLEVRQSYKRWEIMGAGHIRGCHDSADGLTKLKMMVFFTSYFERDIWSGRHTN